MCVIAIAQDKALTDEHVKRMFAANRDGAGIAWREHDRVQWRKGLGEEEMRDLCLTVPIPYVAHFRIASCGGVKPELTHPFPIDKAASLALKGSTPGSVMFHNGHHGRWKDYLLQMALNGHKLPTGPWSDSRLMAWVAAHAGNHVLPFFDEKIVAFSMTDMDIWGTGWTLVDDIYVSNRTWESNYTHNWQGQGQGQGYRHQVISVCRFGACKKNRVDNSVWCEDHPNGVEVHHRVPEVTPIPRTFRGGNSDAERQTTEQEAMEKVAQPVRGTGTQGQTEGPSHATLEAGERMIGWVRKLNPKRLRAVTPVTAERGDDDETSNYYM